MGIWTSLVRMLNTDLAAGTNGYLVAEQHYERPSVLVLLQTESKTVMNQF